MGEVIRFDSKNNPSEVETPFHAGEALSFDHFATRIDQCMWRFTGKSISGTYFSKAMMKLLKETPERYPVIVTPSSRYGGLGIGTQKLLFAALAVLNREKGMTKVKAKNKAFDSYTKACGF